MVTKKGIIYPNRNNHVQDFADSDLVQVNWGWKTPLNVVSVKTPEDFGVLLRAVADYTEMTDYDVKDTARHEESHLEAWRALGATSCVFEVRVLKVALTEDDLRAGRIKKAFKPCTLASNIVAPKLGVAAMNVRPYDPSEGDMNAVYSLGYEGVQDIGDRIKRYNDGPKVDRQILMPLSYVEDL